MTVPQPRKGPKIVTQDEHPRPGTLLEDLARLPAPFRENGTVTAGNASGVNDGAAAVILATEQAAKEGYNAWRAFPVWRLLAWNHELWV